MPSFPAKGLFIKLAKFTFKKKKNKFQIKKQEQLSLPLSCLGSHSLISSHQPIAQNKSQHFSLMSNDS